MRIAVIGAGISGLYSAHRLAQAGHEVVLYEQAEYLGGHTNTHHLGGPENLHVDSGFIVYNQRTYPSFIRFLDELGVASRPAPMSFSVSCPRTGLEYGSASLRSLLARRRNLVDPRFLRMVRDILRFNRDSDRFSAAELDGTLGACLQRRRYSQEFARFYLVPMAAAIWSAPAQQIAEFPLGHFVTFFRNHGLLSVNGEVQWRTVAGGSYRYVEAFRQHFPGELRVAQPVSAVRRHADGVRVSDSAASDVFDQVVLACHSDQALRLLGTDVGQAEREILGAIRYQPNSAVLHTDTRILPSRRASWSAWNYRISPDAGQPVKVSYHMNQLQGLESETDYVVTLNDAGCIDPARVLRRVDYAHPMYDEASDAARARWSEISGQRNTHFCGAYWFSGFHEDGVRSAQRVCDAIGRATTARAA